MKKFWVTSFFVLVFVTLTMTTAFGVPSDELEIIVDATITESTDGFILSDTELSIDDSLLPVIDDINGITLDTTLSDIESHKDSSSNTTVGNSEADELIMTKCIITYSDNKYSPGVTFKVECAALGGVEPYTYNFQLWRERDLVYDTNYFFNTNEYG